MEKYTILNLYFHRGIAYFGNEAVGYSAYVDILERPGQDPVPPGYLTISTAVFPSKEIAERILLEFIEEAHNAGNLKTCIREEYPNLPSNGAK